MSPDDRQALHDAAKAAALAERDRLGVADHIVGLGLPLASNYVVGRIVEAVLAVVEGRLRERDRALAALWRVRMAMERATVDESPSNVANRIIHLALSGIGPDLRSEAQRLAAEEGHRAALEASLDREDVDAADLELPDPDEDLTDEELDEVWERSTPVLLIPPTTSAAGHATVRWDATGAPARWAGDEEA